MGKKLNISQPMVLDVMFAPLVESFQLIPSDTTQQWYYADTNSYLPSHSTDSPLIITPSLSVFDSDNHQTYRPSLNDSVVWSYLNSNGTYTIISNTSESGNPDYVVYTDGHIKVNKEVPPNAPVTLKCEAQYLDPRSSSTSYTVKETIVLTTNRDATLIPVTVDINCEAVQLYDVFKDASSRFIFTAVVTKGLDDITSTSTVKWYVLNKTTGTETLVDSSTTVSGVTIPTYPCYVSGQNMSMLVLDAMYTEDITIVARVVKTVSPLTLHDGKAIRSLMWDVIPMQNFAHSNNGEGVTSGTEIMEFDVISNIRNKTLTDLEKQNNLLFNWKRRGATSSTVVDSGWGQKITIDGDTLRSNNSTLVYAEAYLLGAYEVVTDNGEAVVDDGEPVYDRQ